MAWRGQWLPLALAGLICADMVTHWANAQIVSTPDPAPFAPGDLKRPIFDIQTSRYPLSDRQTKSASTVVAEVDGRAVTLGDTADAIEQLPPNVRAMPFAEVFPGVIDKLVREQALVIRAYQLGLDEDPVVRRKLKAADEQVLANELLHREIARSITEQALLDRYQKAVAGRPGPEEVHARLIAVPSEQAAMGIIANLQAGADFATLARSSSLDATAAAGGDLGYVPLSGLNPELGAVAFSLAVGEFSRFPVHSGGVYFVVQVEDRRRQTTPSFSAARQALMQTLLREGVADVVTQAMAGVAVRKFTIAGKEMLPAGAP